MPIATDVCGISGHKVESLRTNDKAIPVPVPGQSTIVMKVETYIQVCTKCGQTLDQVQGPPKRVRNRSKKSESVPPAPQE